MSTAARTRPAAAEGPVHRQGEHGSGQQLQPDAHDREQGRVPERAPEARVAERLDVVADADERPPEPRHPQVVAVERLPDGPEERKQRDQQDRAQRRQNEAPGEPGFVVRARHGRLPTRVRRRPAVAASRPARPPGRVRVDADP